MLKQHRLRASAPLAIALSALGAAACSAVHESHAPVTRAPGPLPSPSPFARLSPLRASSAVALARAGDQVVALAVDADERAIHTIDVDHKTELAVTPLDGTPAALLVLGDGRVAVSLRDKGAVVVLCPKGPDARLEGCGRAAVADDPVGMALTPDDRTLLVASGWSHTLTALDAKTLEHRFDQDLPREPRAVVVSDDGKRAFVSHAVGSRVSVVNLDSPIHTLHPLPLDATEIDTGGWESANNTVSRTGAQGFTLVKMEGPAAGRILVPEVEVFPGNPAAQSSGYGGGSILGADVFDVAVLDEDKATTLPDSLTLELQGVDCLLPRAAAATASAKLLVACVGIDQVVELEGASARPHEALGRRWQVPPGPMGIAVDDAGRRAVVWSQFARSISVLSFDAPLQATALEPAVSLAVPHGMEAVAPEIELGRSLFHAVDDPRIAADGRACASCHPDGRDDGLTWSTPNGPRQTPMLAGRLEGTAPYAWNGDGATLQKHLGHTMQRLSGRGLSARELDALAAYISTMKSPAVAPVAGAVVARGEAIFHSDEAGCAECHGESGTIPDHLSHDLKTRTRGDANAKFDTPSLRFVAGTAPYFHDGRYPTLRAMLEHTDGKMGHTKDLSPADIDALEAYLRTL